MQCLWRRKITIYKDSVVTSHRASCASIRRNISLVLYRETITAHCKTHVDDHTIRGHDVGPFNVKREGRY
jgi:hypothetical protein